MKKRYSSHLKPVHILGTLLLTFIFAIQLHAQQTSPPFSLDLNLGGGLIGNSDLNTALQPEIGFRFQPGRWGVGLESGFFSFNPSFKADQYRSGFEEFTVVQESDDKWNAFYINAGPRYRFGNQLPIQFSAGLDLALSYQNPPTQRVEFNDPEGNFGDLELPLANFEPDEGFSKWSAAIRPQIQIEFSPFRSKRIGFNVKTGIQHELSDREFTFTERDLSQVQQVSNAREMFFQFETAPEVIRTTSAPKTNFFANAGIKISFGGSKAQRAAPAQGYNAARSNKPSSIADPDGSGIGDCDDDDDCLRPDDVVVVKMEGLAAADNFVDEIIDVLDRCGDSVCKQVRLNADGRVGEMRKAREGQLSQDEAIEQVHSIVMEDVVSLSKCESDVCRDVLRKEIQLLEHMNVLMSLVQSGRAAEAQDYNAARSNKPSSIADGIGDGDQDSDDDGVDDAIETAQDYNAARSNKPSSIADRIGDGKGSGLQVVYIMKDEDGKIYAWGAAPEAKSRDEGGKLYSWGRAPENLASDGKGQVYAWGDNSRASIRNGEGKVYAWGIAARANAADDEGKLYAWGVRPQVESGASDQRGIDKKDIRQGMVTDTGPGQLGNALYLAKELGLASAGNDIENIKEVLDRCDDGVCEQVRLNADYRDKGVRRALENPSEMDSEIEEILNIVKEDVESLGTCETDVCREVLAMEEELLVKMNRLNDMDQVAPAQDYNSSRSNKPRTENNRGGNDEIIRDASRMARLINPSGQIISAGAVMMGSNNPLYKDENRNGENPLYEGQANDGDSDNNNNEDPVPVQRYDLQPSSYCVELGSTAPQGKSAEAQGYNAARSNKPSSRSADTGEGDLDSDNDSIDDAIETAQDYNAARSNKPSSIADIGDVDGDGFPDILKNASFSISKRSARTGRNEMNNGDLDGDVDGFHFEMEVEPLDEDTDGDGLLDGLESASYSISKRSRRTGRSENQENPLAVDEMEWVDSALQGMHSPNNVYQWTYQLNELSGTEQLPGTGTLTVLFTGGKWHFDLQIDPVDMDDDGDGLIELIQNSSFSISKRSARM